MVAESSSCNARSRHPIWTPMGYWRAGLVCILAGSLAPNLTHAQDRKLPAAIAPTKVRLELRDTPVDQAVAELSRKIGYLIFLDDADGKLKKRTITLNTGDVTYWEAVEQVCAKGGLVEGVPGVALGPKVLPKLPPPPKPGEPIPLIKIGDGTPIFRTVRGVLTLKDGMPKAVSTDTSSAVRIKVSQRFTPASSVDEMTCTLQVNPEPKLRWEELVGIRIDRAIDDNGQMLQQAKKVAAPKFGGKFGGGNPGMLENDNAEHVAVRLVKGAKPAASLRELKGAISARVSVSGAALLTVDDIAKAQGKLIKGAQGASMKVGAASAVDGDDIQIPVELTLSANLVGPAKIGAGNSAAPLPGFKVLDAKGMPIPIISMTRALQNPGPPGAAVEYQVRVRPAADQKPTKVSYASQQIITVDIPFSLKDVSVR